MNNALIRMAVNDAYFIMAFSTLLQNKLRAKRAIFFYTFELANARQNANRSLQRIRKQAPSLYFELS